MARTAFPLAICGTAAVGIAWALRDYRAWRALGPGGLPADWAGWRQATRWRAVSLAPNAIRRRRREDVATLADLPRRAGRRPRVGQHPVPHRQLSQRGSASIRSRVADVFAAKLRADTVRLCEAVSHFERHTSAITVREPFCRHGDARAAAGEVAHIHPTDGSMHMILSPSDAGIAIAQGWGERHGLAGLRLKLPYTYLMIYAPRDAGEVAAVSRLLDAAVEYMTLKPSVDVSQTV